jgi:heptosyltransferase-2
MPLSSVKCNLLVIRLSSFGDIVLAEPLTRALKHHWPDGQIWFVADRRFTAIPNMFGAVDKVVAYERAGDHHNLREELGGIEFDLAVDLQNSLRSRRITAGLRIERLARFRRQRLRRLLCVYAPWLWKGALKHTTEAYAETVARLGIDTADLLPSMRPPPGRLAQLREQFGRERLVGICPGGSSEHKRWPEARFAELVGLLASSGRGVVLMGAEGDRAVVEAVRDRLDGVHADLFVGDDIDAIASILALCEVVVANDSGLMHLAGAVGAKVVALFGPTSALLGFAPKARRSVIVTRNLPCSPCSYHGNRACRLDRRACLDDIEAGEVAEAVGRLMGEEEDDADRT